MIFQLVYKASRRLINSIGNAISHIIAKIVLNGNGVKYSNFRTSGIPYVMVAKGGNFTIGANFAMNNGIKGNPIGSYNPCTFVVDKGATLKIGNNVGISQTALICHDSITIGNFVKIGGGVCIYDTDFHALNPELRKSGNDLNEKVKSPVIINDNAFIGAHSIILKGVTIGKNSVVGAGSVVTKSVPHNQIWAGNPAKYIKDI